MCVCWLVGRSAVFFLKEQTSIASIRALVQFCLIVAILILFPVFIHLRHFPPFSIKLKDKLSQSFCFVYESLDRMLGLCKDNGHQTLRGSLPSFIKGHKNSFR